MLRNSFILLDRVREKTERRIRDSGISDWQDFLDAERIAGISSRSKHYHDRKIRECMTALREGDTSYFSRKMPGVEVWRLYEYFRDEAVFIDIEASGSSLRSQLIVFGMFDGYDTKIMVKDVNLDITRLAQELKGIKLIVTFNGSTFDLPFLRKRYPHLLPPVPHFDLRHACASIGLAGSLKDVEQKLAIKRQNFIVEQMYEGNPLSLWRKYISTGDRYYINLLVEYNEEDVINLKKIAEYVVKEKKKNYFDLCEKAE